MDIKSFFSDLGVPANLAEFLINGSESDKLPDNYDPQSELDQWNDGQSAVWKARLGETIKQEVAEKLNRATRTKAKSIVDAFGLEVTKTEAFEKGLDDMIKMASDAMNKRISDATNASNEEITADRDRWKARSASLQQELEDANAKHVTDLEAAKKSAESQIHQYKLKEVYNGIFKELDYGVKPGTQRMFEESAVARINGSYHVELDGTLFAKDGKSPALSLDGKRTLKTVNEAIDELASGAEVLKKSNLGEGGGGGEADDKGGKLSDAAQRMKARFEQARKGAK